MSMTMEKDEEKEVNPDEARLLGSKQHMMNARMGIKLTLMAADIRH